MLDDEHDLDGGGGKEETVTTDTPLADDHPRLEFMAWEDR